MERADMAGVQEEKVKLLAQQSWMLQPSILFDSKQVKNSDFTELTEHYQ